MLDKYGSFGYQLTVPEKFLKIVCFSTLLFAEILDRFDVIFTRFKPFWEAVLIHD
jgi:hypothetical protein